MDYITENVNDILRRIETAAGKSGRSPEDITIIGVTKTIDVPHIQKLAELGIRDLGENKVQELLDKYGKLENVNWHMIGHLQTNKVKYIIDKTCLIHSVDSIKLANEIQRRAGQKNLIKDVLIEINIANEDTKYGVLPEDADTLALEISKMENLRLRGLMCIAPFVENSEQNREYFIKMRNLFIDISGRIDDNVYMNYLSMGMTNDFETAIEEGANMVRIGTGIFGSRNTAI